MILIFSRLVVNFFLLTGLTKGGVETGKIIVLILMLCELLFLICFFYSQVLQRLVLLNQVKDSLLLVFGINTFGRHLLVCTRNIIIDHFSVFNLVRQILKLSCSR